MSLFWGLRILNWGFSQHFSGNTTGKIKCGSGKERAIETERQKRIGKKADKGYNKHVLTLTYCHYYTL